MGLEWAAASTPTAAKPSKSRTTMRVLKAFLFVVLVALAAAILGGVFGGARLPCNHRSQQVGSRGGSSHAKSGRPRAREEPAKPPRGDGQQHEVKAARPIGAVCWLSRNRWQRQDANGANLYPRVPHLRPIRPRIDRRRYPLHHRKRSAVDRNAGMGRAALESSADSWSSSCSFEACDRSTGRNSHCRRRRQVRHITSALRPAKNVMRRYILAGRDAHGQCGARSPRPTQKPLSPISPPRTLPSSVWSRLLCLWQQVEAALLHQSWR